MNESLGIKKIDTLVYEKWLHRLLSHWYFFVLSLCIAYSVTYIYLRYAKTIYAVSSTILIKDASQNINPFEATRNMSMGDYNYGGRTYNLSNDIKILSSKKLIQETLSKMDWKVQYFIKGNIKNSQVYPFDIFKVVYSDSSTNIPYGISFVLKPVSSNQFQLTAEDNETWNGKLMSFYTINEWINIDGFQFKVVTSEFLPSVKEAVYVFNLNAFTPLVYETQSKLRVMQMDKSSSVITLSTQGSCSEWEKELLNTLCNTYMSQTLLEKNITHERAIVFIDGQLQNISDTLQSLENKMVTYRKKYSGSNLEQIAEKRFSKLEMLEEDRAKYTLSLRYFTYLKNYLQSKKSFTDVVAPASIGIEEPVLSSLLKELLEQTLKQNTTFKVESTTNPFLQDNENKINQIKRNIYEVLSNIEASYHIKQEDIEQRIQLLSKHAINLLDNERSYYELKRQYKINEELYTILLKKKAEMSIIRAGNVSDTKIVDSAVVTGIPFPNIRKLYTTNLLLALLIPLVFVFLRYLTSYKVMDREDVSSECAMPFLGAIGHMPDKDNMVVSNKPKSIMAEAFRSIRANLQFFMKGDKKVVVVSSSLSGDGKTFTSLNIASIFAISGKKTVLIGADMRKPKVYLNTKTPTAKGLSQFLSQEAILEEIIYKTDIIYLDFIPSGTIPPNPAELLISQKTEELISRLKQKYDIILFDTPPLGLVSDALSLMEFADANIFVVRHNHTPIRFIKELNEYIQSGKIQNMAFILNDFDIRKNYGYGYRYGGYAQKSYGQSTLSIDPKYGFKDAYSEDTFDPKSRSWWKKWFNKT